MSRRVLLIAYYFPPLGLAGVSRPLALFKRLPEAGWDCHILTVKPVLYRAYEPELLEGLDLSKIHRAGSRDPQRLLYLAGLRRAGSEKIRRADAASQRFFPDSKAGWIKPATRLGRTLVDNYRYDWIISTSPPISAHLIARNLKRECSVRWLADFRDPWTMRPVEKSFTDDKQIEKGKKLLRDITTEADTCVGVTNDVTRLVGAGEVIRNGYDSGLATGWDSPPPRAPFGIGVLGHHHDEFLIKPLVDLIEKINSERPDLIAKMRVIQVGQADETDFRSSFEAHGLNIQIECHGRLGRRDTIEVMRQAHLLYLSVPEQGENTPIPLRAFDMIRSGRPVLAVASENSEVWNILGETGRAFRLDDSTIDAAVRYVDEIVRQVDEGSFLVEPPDAGTESFSDRTTAERFAEIMERS